MCSLLHSMLGNIRKLLRWWPRFKENVDLRRMFYLNAPLTTTVSISSGGINITRQTIFFMFGRTHTTALQQMLKMSTTFSKTILPTFHYQSVNSVFISMAGCTLLHALWTSAGVIDVKSRMNTFCSWIHHVSPCTALEQLAWTAA
jgi:hypothetical protein